MENVPPEIDRTPPRERILALIRAAMDGLKAGLVGGGALPCDGTQVVRIGDWRIRFFIDAGCLDYVDRLEAPDGRTWGYDVVGPALDVLTEAERRDVERWLGRVEPWH